MIAGDMRREVSDVFKSSQFRGSVNAGEMGEMQDDDGCGEPRAVVMSCCKSIIQEGGRMRFGEQECVLDKR